MNCYVCKKVCNSLPGLLAHYKNEQTLRSNDRYKCGVCPAVFDRLAKFKKHAKKCMGSSSVIVGPISSTELSKTTPYPCTSESNQIN
jgi:hypothetical protein